MAKLVHLLDSPQGDRDHIDLHYVCEDAATYLEAYICAYQNTPNTLYGLPRKSPPLKIEPFTTPVDWDVVASYDSGQKNKEDEPGDCELGFDFSLENVKITHSRRHIARYTAPGEPAAPDLKGALNYDGNEVQGTEVGVPKGEFNEKWILPGEFLTQAYLRTIYTTIGTVNDGAWRGMKAGELLFMGASGQDQKDGSWSIAFKYGFSRDEVNLTIGDGAITIPHKEGWEYVWVRFAEKSVDLGGGKMVRVKRPIHAYLEQVFPAGRFSNLLLGSDAWNLAQQAQWAERQGVGALAAALAGWSARRRLMQGEDDLVPVEDPLIWRGGGL